MLEAASFFPSIFQHCVCCGFLVSEGVVDVACSSSAELLCKHITNTPMPSCYLIYTHVKLDLASLWTYLFAYVFEHQYDFGMINFGCVHQQTVTVCLGDHRPMSIVVSTHHQAHPLPSYLLNRLMSH